jgi:hypothetical protein
VGAEEDRHFDRRDSGLPALVVRALARPGHRLRLVVRGQYTEGDRHTGVAGRLHHAVRDGGRDVLEVRGVAPDHAPEAEDRVEAAGFSEAPGGLRKLVRAGNVHRVHAVGASLRQHRLGGPPERLGHRGVEAGHHHGEAIARG